MQLILRNIVPKFIAHWNDSEIWNQEVVVEEGEYLHIVAPSGSGKSTLIHFIYGIRNDYSGSILLHEKDIRNFSQEEKASLRQNRISIVFQDLRLFPESTARENIEIKRQLHPYHPVGKIDEMASILGIENKLGQKAKYCSYGEQQRIAIIRALMQPFEILLLDEPFSHLDESNREKAMRLIDEECRARKATLIFADLKQLDYFKDDKTINL